MRESIGGAWLFTLVISFILLFTGFLCVAVNYNKAFKVKNEVIDYIEREEGLTLGTTGKTGDAGGSIELINTFLKQNGYASIGKCENGWMGVSSLDGNAESVSSDKKYYYCVQKKSVNDSSNKYKSYYKVRVFFKFELPIFGDFTTFHVDGETTQIEYPGDCYTWGNCPK